MTQICKEKAAIKKFSMFKNEKLIEIPSWFDLENLRPAYA
jgi:hypothetical protein